MINNKTQAYSKNENNCMNNDSFVYFSTQTLHTFVFKYYIYIYTPTATKEKNI